MTNTQFVKTMISGLAFMLASLTGPSAWAISRGVITHLPKEYATGCLITTIACVLIIVAVWVFIKEPKTN